MKKTNILFIIWGLIVITVVILLTVLGFMIKNVKSNYKKTESTLRLSAEKYTATNFEYPQEGHEVKITKKEIMDAGYLEKDLKVNEDVCDGYVIVKTNQVVEYEAFIKCGKYTTKGYQE